MISTKAQMLTEQADALIVKHGHTREEFMSEARGWLTDCGILDDESDDVTDVGVLRLVAREYDGGLAAFAAAF